MIHTGRIERTLIFLDREYGKNLSSYDKERPIIISKLALLEYCGGIEESFDEIARNCVRKKLKTSESRRLLEKKIQDTHGFTYKNCLQPLLAYSLGTIKLLDIEKKLKRNGNLIKLSTELGNLNSMRREAAHTYTTGRTSTFPSPSVVISSFRTTEPIIREIWQLVRQ